MRLNITKGPTWTCELCHNRNNSPASTVCSICKSQRPKYRFGIQIEGKYYICKVKIISFLPSISVCEVSTAMCDFFVLDIGESENSIEECIILAIKQRQQVKHKRVSIVTEDSIGFPELEHEELDSLPVLNNTISPKKSSLKGGQRSTTGNSNSNNNSLISMFDPGLSLFDTVMQNASTVAYDGKIGQYVSMKAIRQCTGTSTEDNDSQMIKKNFSYVDSMRKERIVMTQVVKEVVKRREDDSYIYDAKADLDINRNEWDKYIECEMCERFYPKSQMPGQISFKAIADWKIQHNAPISSSDHRLDSIRLHDPKRLCIFCTQFFNINSNNLIDKTIIKENIGFHKNDMNGPLNCSNTVYKRIFRKAMKIKTELEDRPLSRMRHRIALEQLKFKAKMKENTGSRFLFNPKVMNSVVDQEKVGKFLRNKYAQSSAGAVLVSEKKASNKLTLQPLRTTAPSASKQSHNNTSSSSAFLTCADNSMSHIADTSISHKDTVKARRSLSASTATAGSQSSSSRRVTTGGDQKSIMKERNLHIKENNLNSKVNKNTTTPILSNTINITNSTGNSLDLLNNSSSSSIYIDHSNTDVIDSSNRKTKKKPKSKSVSFCNATATSFDSLTSLHSSGEIMGKIQSKQQNKKKIRQHSSTRNASETRKPLILKVSSAAVVGGSGDSGKTIEIELPSGAGSCLITKRGQEDGVSHAGRNSIGNSNRQQYCDGGAQQKNGTLSPLKGLLQNMKLTRREPQATGDISTLPSNATTSTPTNITTVAARSAEVAGATKEESKVEGEGDFISISNTHDAEHSNELHNNTLPIKLQVKKSVKMNTVATPPSQQQEQQSHIHNQKASTKNDVSINKNAAGNNKTSEKSPKYSNKTDSVSWKNNINKPILLKESSSNSNSTTTSPVKTSQQQPQHVSPDELEIQEEEVLEEEEEEVADEVSAGDEGNSTPVAQHISHQHKQHSDSGLLSKTRSDSFASDDVYTDEYDDSFEVDEELPTSSGNLQHLDPWAGDSMEGYNWVSAGPYIPEEQGEEGAGFSPVMFEASLLGQSIDRMRMLSRGSAGGLMTPTSRNNTAGSRRYSGRHTPKLLSSAGDVGFPPYSSSSRHASRNAAPRISQELQGKEKQQQQQQQQRSDNSAHGIINNGSGNNTTTSARGNSSKAASLLRKVDQASHAYSGAGSSRVVSQAAAASLPVKPRRRARA